ncbi:MAG: DUF1178 family protein [Pseudomonadota bacterium]
MIQFRLKCENDHQFDGWFPGNEAFDRQAAEGALVCPHCGSTRIEKALMAPAVHGAKKQAVRRAVGPAGKPQSVATEGALPAAYAAMARKVRDYVETNFDNVGKDFPEEVRKIHYGEAEERGIYGEANSEDVKSLTDEGIAIAPVPDPDKTPGGQSVN